MAKIGLNRSILRMGAVALALVIAMALSFFVSSALAEKDGAKEKAIEPAAWSVRCQPQEDGKTAEKKSCEVFQRLVQKETSARVAEFAIGFPDGGDVARGVVIFPLGLLIQDGVEMRIDEGKPYAFKIRYCLNAGCFAYVNLDKAIIDSLSKAKAANFAFKAADGKDVALSMSLAGFGSALKQIR